MREPTEPTRHSMSPDKGQPFAPPQSRERMTSCRACRHVFSRKYGSCPRCGAARHHRRPSKQPLHALQERIEHGLLQGWRWLRRRRDYVLFVGGGLLAGPLLYPAVMSLADHSMPPGWREARGQAGWSMAHALQPFVAAGETLARWFVQLMIAIANWLVDDVFGIAIRHPSAVFFAVLFGTVGAFIAWRRQRRHRQRRRSRVSPASSQPDEPS
jgi:hypothetical protein